MTQTSRMAAGPVKGLAVALALLAGISPGAYSSTEYPLEPPDRSSPRTTLTTFLDLIDEAWELYSADDPGFEGMFRDARECLDLSAVPPLVYRDFSAEAALTLKDVLDRIELPPPDEIPDRAAVEDLGLKRWTVPHTEIRLIRIAEGEREGEWVFSQGTVDRAEEFYERVRHLPYQPGRAGGHIEELRAATRAVLLRKLTEVAPLWFSSDIAGTAVWQWFGLALVLVVLLVSVLVIAWIGRRWRNSGFPGHGVAGYLVPLALSSVPLAGQFLLDRLFELPGRPALWVRLLFSIVGYFGLAWLVAVTISKVGNLTVRLWFGAARPLKQQLVRVVFRIANIVVVTAVAVKAMQILGVPIAGLVAGVSVGGLAVALAAQETLQNLIGGIILYADQPVRVGDFCRFGDKNGTVEDVGLRSVKIRTLARTLVTVPNANFAEMQLENLSQRDRTLLSEKVRLRYETTVAQLRSILSNLEAMLHDDTRIADEPLRVKFAGFGEYSLEIDLFAYALTSDWAEFLSIRQDLLVSLMEIVERAGTGLALPTEVHYGARDVERPDEQTRPAE